MALFHLPTRRHMIKTIPISLYNYFKKYIVDATVSVPFILFSLIYPSTFLVLPSIRQSCNCSIYFWLHFWNSFLSHANLVSSISLKADSCLTVWHWYIKLLSISIWPSLLNENPWGITILLMHFFHEFKCESYLTVVVFSLALRRSSFFPFASIVVRGIT